MGVERQMPLWGWGDPDRVRDLPQSVVEQIEARLGPARDSVSRVESGEDFDLPRSRLGVEQLARLRDALGTDAVTDDPADRLLRSHGKSYPDMLRMRAGQPAVAPDAVVRVASRDQLRRCLGLLSDLRIAAVPFAGGTSVVGGLEARSEGLDGSVSLDLSGLRGLEHLDVDSRIATFLPGTLGPEAEVALAAEGLTTGHFPQSWEYASLGGFAATRSAGQSSSGYGRFCSNVLGLAMTTPSGRIDLDPFPATASGPDLRELVMGSEGTLGVIDRLDLQVEPVPAAVRDLAWVAPDFRSGRTALRALAQSAATPDVVRLSCETETEINLILAGDSPKISMLRKLMRLRRGDEACMLVTGFEGGAEDVARRAKEAGEILRRAGCGALGPMPARAWRRHRFDGPYTRDSLMDLGYFVETLETAAPWSGLDRLFTQVKGALRSSLEETSGSEALVLCHVSHLYPAGASLYFTFASRTPSAELEPNLEQWQLVKARACDAIKAAGGTITHHHAIGSDHAPWMEAEIGPTSLRVLRAIKAELDPNGIMNPGRLLLRAPEMAP